MTLRDDALPQGAVVAIAGQHGPMADERAGERQVPPSEHPADDEVLAALGWAVAVVDRTGTIVRTNPAWGDLAAQRGAVGQHYLESQSRGGGTPDIDLVVGDGIERVLSGRSARFDLEYPVERSGANVWHLVVATPLPGWPGWGVIAHVDVTLHHDVTEILDAQAQRDALTGLPNRRAVGERLSAAVNRARRGGGRVSVVFIDLDGFKAVNDELGHDVGDEVLVAVGRRLSRTVRSDDALGRWGGDEFVVVMDGGEEAIRSLARRLHAVMEEPVAVGGARTVVIRLSVGGAEARTGVPVDDVVARADRAMFRAKRSREGFALDAWSPPPAQEPVTGER